MSQNQWQIGCTPAFLDTFDGVLLVDKPAGITSHDVVDRIRRRFRFEKVGHGGTLDPQCTGLLVVMIGRGTKMSGTIMAFDKTYEGTMRLGISTDTQDAEGKVLSERDPSGVTRDALVDEMAKLTGDIMHVPPMVSAVKKDGVPLYKLARKGKTVERVAKLVHIYEFTLLAFNPPRADFLVRCSKGVYVRTLCSDVGDALGCGAHLERLRRTAAGGYQVAQALPLDLIMEMDRDALRAVLIPLHKVACPAPGR